MLDVISIENVNNGEVVKEQIIKVRADIEGCVYTAAAILNALAKNPEELDTTALTDAALFYVRLAGQILQDPCSGVK